MIRVIGFGNLLHGDDAYASHVLSMLEQRNLSHDIELIFAGTAGLNAMSLFENCSQILIVDIIHFSAAKADLAWYSVDEVITFDSGASDHGIGLGYLFKALQCVDLQIPNIHCLLLRTDMPQSYCLSMSDNSNALVSIACERILEKLGCLQ